MLYIPSTMVFWSTYYNVQELIEAARSKATRGKNGKGEGGNEVRETRKHEEEFIYTLSLNHRSNNLLNLLFLTHFWNIRFIWKNVHHYIIKYWRKIGWSSEIETSKVGPQFVFYRPLNLLNSGNGGSSSSVPRSSSRWYSGRSCIGHMHQSIGDA